MEYYSAIKKNEIMPFVATWMGLDVILSEVRERQISYDITYMWNLKKKKIQMNLFTKQKQNHKLREQTYGYQRGEGEGYLGSLGFTCTHYYILNG